MRTLLAKDLRLAGDALGPWALTVGGFVVAAVAATRMPPSIFPVGYAPPGVADVLAITGFLLAATAGVVAIWAAAAVAQGDRAHGADHLAAALPIPRPRRIAAKLLAVASVAVAPAIAAAACALAARLLGDATARDAAPTLRWCAGFAGATALVGAGIGLGVVPAVRGRFRTVILAIAVVVATGLTGAATSLGGVALAAAPLIAWVRDHGAESGIRSAELESSKSLAASIAAAVAIATVGIIGLLCGSTWLGTAPRRKSMAIAGIAGVALAIVAGGGVGYASFGAEQSLQWSQPWVRWQASLLTERELGESLRKPPELVRGTHAINAALLDARSDAIARSLLRLDEPARRAHPLMHTLREEWTWSADRALLRLLTRQPQGTWLEGEELVELAVDGATRFPSSRTEYLWLLAMQTVSYEAFVDLQSRIAGWPNSRRADDPVLLTMLESLRDRYPAQAAAINRLLVAIRPALPPLPPPVPDSAEPQPIPDATL